MKNVEGGLVILKLAVIAGTVIALAVGAFYYVSEAEPIENVRTDTGP